MSKLQDEYILRCLSKIRHKKWEYFVVSRIIHKLDDFDIEFVTQQLVRRPDGSRALTDLFFPQFNIHLEIDESHHFKKSVDLDDAIRQQDIIDQTGHEVVRISVWDAKAGSELPLSTIAYETDNFVQRLQKKRQAQEAQGVFSPWDYERRFDPERIIEKGFISVSDNVLFRRQIDAMKCFGFTGTVWRRGAWRIPDERGYSLWFPRLFEHDVWSNELCEGGRVINERARSEPNLRVKARASLSKQRRDLEKNPDANIIVFSKAKDPLGKQLLRYVGTFKANLGVEHFSPDNLRFELVRDTQQLWQPVADT